MFRPFYNGHLQASILGGVVNTTVIRNIRDLVSRAKTAVYYHILVGVRVVNSPSFISTSLIPAVRDVSGCRACIGFCFRSACLLFRFKLVPRPAGWGVDLKRHG
jgi:tryptophan synthase alpha subunit